MEQAEVHVSDRIIGSVSPYLFGGLTEHFGTGIYGGLWDVERGTPRGRRAGSRSGPEDLGSATPAGASRTQRPVHEETYWTGFPFGSVVAEDIAHGFALPE